MNQKPDYTAVLYLLLSLTTVAVLYGFSASNEKFLEEKAARIQISAENEISILRQEYALIEQNLLEINEHLAELSENKSLHPEQTSQSSAVISSQPAELRTEMEIPAISTNVKLFTDYRSYNLKYTPHYRLQQAAYTDELGFRRFNNDYIVALGSYYSTSIGDRFEVTLDTGTVFTVIFGDGKWDSDCDSRNMYTPCTDYNGDPAGNLLEFIVDKKVLDKEVFDYGSVELLDKFNGSVAKMVYLGRDTSADWDTYENGHNYR